MPLIDVKNLKTYFYTWDGVVRAVDGVDFSIEPEKTLGVVGESGCGKSVTAQTIMGLIQMPPGRIESGEIIYHQNGNVVDLVKLNPKGEAMRGIRGNEIAMIFQEPMTSLSPVHTIGDQITDVMLLHTHLSRRETRERAVELLDSVGVPRANERIEEYTFQYSGGTVSYTHLRAHET